jgi:hypothetical protein
MGMPERVVIRVGVNPKEGWSAVLRAVSIESELRRLQPNSAVTVIASGGSSVFDFVYRHVRDLVEAPDDGDAEGELTQIPLPGPIRFAWVEGTRDDARLAAAWSRRAMRVAWANADGVHDGGTLAGSMTLDPLGLPEELRSVAFGASVNRVQRATTDRRAPCCGGALHLRLHAITGTEQVELARLLQSQRSPWASQSIEARPDLTRLQRSHLAETDLHLMPFDSIAKDAALADLWVVDTVSSAVLASTLGIPFLLAPAFTDSSGRLSHFCRRYGGWFVGRFDPSTVSAVLRVRARDAARLYERSADATETSKMLSWRRVFSEGLPALVSESGIATVRAASKLGRKEFPPPSDGRKSTHIQG